MKKSLFSLPVQKLSLLLSCLFIQFLGKESTLFFEQDKRRRLTMVAGTKESATNHAQRMDRHTYGGRRCFVTILKNMSNIKNFVSANCVMVLTSKVAVLTLAGKGGAL
jgi:hypothetical protein